MRTLVGVGPECLQHLTLAASKLSIGNAAAIVEFNQKHHEIPPIDKIHDEIAFRLYPFLKEAYRNTLNLIAIASQYLRQDVGSSLPRPDDLSSLTEIGDIAIKEIVPLIRQVKRADRTSEEHAVLRKQIDLTAASYTALAVVCEQALDDR
jgi:hypothetical protein